MTDLSDLEEIEEQTSGRVNFKENGAGAKIGTHHRPSRRGKGTSLFAGLRRTKPKPVTLPTRAD